MTAVTTEVRRSMRFWCSCILSSARSKSGLKGSMGPGWCGGWVWAEGEGHAGGLGALGACKGCGAPAEAVGVSVELLLLVPTVSTFVLEVRGDGEGRGATVCDSAGRAPMTWLMLVVDALLCLMPPLWVCWLSDGGCGGVTTGAAGLTTWQGNS